MTPILHHSYLLKNAILEGFIEDEERSFAVIPAKAGIQVFLELPGNWTPVFTGVTTFHK